MYSFFDYIPHMAYGGSPQQGSDNEMEQVITIYSKMSGMKPDLIVQKLKQMKPDQQKKAYSEMRSTVVKAIQQQQMSEQEPDPYAQQPMQMQQPMVRNGGYISHDGSYRQAKGTGTNQGNVYFKDGGMPCYECGGMYAYGGDVIPNYMKETSPMYNFGGYFPQGPRFEDGGQTMDNTMMGMINVFQEGGIVVGQTYDATPELLQKLSEGGYTYEFV